MFPHLTIDRTSGIPIYHQLAERIRLLVREGRLRPGDALPTVRALAVELKINANTVARVYRDLQNDGVLTLERGIGTRVADTSPSVVPKADLRQLEKKAAEIIALARGAGMTPSEVLHFIETRWEESDHVEG